MLNKKASGLRSCGADNSAYKARMALATLRQNKTMAGLCEQFELHPSPITD